MDFEFSKASQDLSAFSSRLARCDRSNSTRPGSPGFIPALKGVTKPILGVLLAIEPPAEGGLAGRSGVRISVLTNVEPEANGVDARS